MRVIYIYIYTHWHAVRRRPSSWCKLNPTIFHPLGCSGLARRASQSRTPKYHQPPELKLPPKYSHPLQARTATTIVSPYPSWNCHQNIITLSELKLQLKYPHPLRAKTATKISSPSISILPPKYPHPLGAKTATQTTWSVSQSVDQSVSLPDEKQIAACGRKTFWSA